MYYVGQLNREYNAAANAFIQGGTTRDYHTSFTVYPICSYLLCLSEDVLNGGR